MKKPALPLDLIVRLSSASFDPSMITRSQFGDCKPIECRRWRDEKEINISKCLLCASGAAVGMQL